MTERTTLTQAAAFSHALAAEVKAEMARQDIRSVRALADRLGTNNVYWNDRLNRSGPRVEIGMADLYRVSEVLGLAPDVLVRRAIEAMG